MLVFWLLRSLSWRACTVLLEHGGIYIWIYPGPGWKGYIQGFPDNAISAQTLEHRLQQQQNIETQIPMLLIYQV